jgi:hypothetical protein
VQPGGQLQPLAAHRLGALADFPGAAHRTAEKAPGPQLVPGGRRRCVSPGPGGDGQVRHGQLREHLAEEEGPEGGQIPDGAVLDQALEAERVRVTAGGIRRIRRLQQSGDPGQGVVA